MAEQLLPVINLATWKDRASVARAAGKDVPLRELRSIVASSSTVTLDEEGSEMAAALRTSLDQRVTALRERWVERITTALDEGRVVDAVRASIRPPEPAARLTAELGRPAGRRRRPGHVGRDAPGGVAGPPRGGGRLAGAPDGQAGRPARRAPTRRCWPRPARRRATCPNWPG